MLPVKHSVNLYLPRFQPAQLSPQVLLLIKSLLITISGFASLTILLFIYQLYSSAQVTALEIERENLNSELAKLIEKYPNVTVDNNLQIRVDRQNDLLTKKRRAISFLRQDSISEKSSFTALFEQLSQQTVKGIWLSKIEIVNRGDDIQLSGFSKTPDKVSHYLTTLGTQDAYRGRAFKQINIMQGEMPWNEFFLSTQKPLSDELSVTKARTQRMGL